MNIDTHYVTIHGGEGSQGYSFMVRVNVPSLSEGKPPIEWTEEQRDWYDGHRRLAMSMAVSLAHLTMGMQVDSASISTEAEWTEWGESEGVTIQIDTI